MRGHGCGECADVHVCRMRELGSPLEKSEVKSPSGPMRASFFECEGSVAAGGEAEWGGRAGMRV